MAESCEFPDIAGGISVATVHIFMTDQAVESYEDFYHDDDHVVFSRLSPEGPKRLIEGPAWAFIDWVMPNISGLEMCRRLRSDQRIEGAHVTLVLEDDDAEDKRRALRAGADDYVIGPLDRWKVLDRVLTAVKGPVSPVLDLKFATGRLEIDIAAQQARWDGAAIALRPNEFSLLRYFAENSDRVLTRQDLISGLGKKSPPVDERTVDVWIGRLRSALRSVGAGEAIRTVRPLGYAFDSR